MENSNSVSNSNSGGVGYIVLLIALVVFISFLNANSKSNPNDNIKNENVIQNLNNDSNRINVTDNEFYWLTMLVACEGGHETQEGQIAIAATVLNRLNASYNGATCIADVIFDPYQYSCVWGWDFHIGEQAVYYSNLEEMGLDVETIENSVKAALNGEDPTKDALGGGAYYYYNPDATSDEELETRKNITKKIRIGNHIFYRIWD
ncbi:MAG: cell wall hydrolase [Clostridia bacterium]|nr:cell wall hydrolase [Clostridia bacterium]